MTRRAAPLLAALALLAGPLCAPSSAQTALSAPDPRAVPVDPHFFDYDSAAPFASTETPEPAFQGVRVVRVTFPSPVQTPYPVDNVVTGYLFLPNTPGPHPAVLVEHEWLPVNLNNEYKTAAGIAEGGMIAFLVVQPYSFNRRLTPRVPDVELLSGDVPQMVSAFHQAVLDNRRALDYLSRRPDVDPTRFGVSGISLGGLLAPLIAGVDKRIKVLVTIVGGVDVSDIVSDSFITYGLRPDLLYHGETYDSVKRKMAEIEPSNRLAGFNPANALLFNGRYDVFVSPKSARHLSRDLGGAKIVWIPTGHYGSVLAEKQIEKVGVAFLRSRFGLDAAPYTPPSQLAAPTIKIGLIFGGHETVSPMLAYQAVTFGPQQRLSLDGQLTTRGLAIAPSLRLDESNSLGFEFPLLHGGDFKKPRLFYFFHFVL